MIYNTCHTANQFQDPKFSVSMIYLKLMKHIHFSEVVKNQQRHKWRHGYEKYSTDFTNSSMAKWWNTLLLNWTIRHQFHLPGSILYRNGRTDSPFPNPKWMQCTSLKAMTNKSNLALDILLHELLCQFYRQQLNASQLFNWPLPLVFDYTKTATFRLSKDMISRL